MSKMGLRKTLLVAQFTFSLIFIIIVTVVYNQLKLFMNFDKGFDTSSKIIVRTGEADKQVVKNELKKFAGINSVSAASHIPSAGIVYGHGFKKSLADEDWTSMNYFSVDEDYLMNMNMNWWPADSSMRIPVLLISISSSSMKRLSIHFSFPQMPMRSDKY